jgi:hypothetical protein
VMSLTATKSISIPCCFAAQKKFRPIRPKPLKPTLMLMPCLLQGRGSPSS